MPHVFLSAKPYWFTVQHLGTFPYCHSDPSSAEPPLAVATATAVECALRCVWGNSGCSGFRELRGFVLKWKGTDHRCCDCWPPPLLLLPVFLLCHPPPFITLWVSSPHSLRSCACKLSRRCRLRQGSVVFVALKKIEKGAEATSMFNCATVYSSSCNFKFFKNITVTTVCQAPKMTKVACYIPSLLKSYANFVCGTDQNFKSHYPSELSNLTCASILELHD